MNPGIVRSFRTGATTNGGNREDADQMPMEFNPLMERWIDPGLSGELGNLALTSEEEAALVGVPEDSVGRLQRELGGS
jgi:hypothetical protein